MEISWDRLNLRVGSVIEIYNAMKKEDFSEVVMVALDAMKSSMNLEAKKKEKSEEKSNEYRIKGNHALTDKKFQKALIFYNSALLYAPKDSRAMKLAYSNRSAIFFKFELYKASLADIEKCFSLGCPDDIVAKLKKRQQDCNSRLLGEKLTECFFSSSAADNYFAMNVPRNPQIPCASTSVGVVMETDVPKVVAAKDIDVGDIVAIETAFVVQSDKVNVNFSCYYCQRMSLNLFPCDNCCTALFCSDECQTKCLEEYHSIECKIMDLITIVPSQLVVIAIKAVLKMRGMTNSWEEFMAESKIVGKNRMKDSSINEIFDSKNRFSLTCYDDDKYFKYSKMYNHSFTCAAAIHALSKIPGYLPKKAEKKQQAMKALARTMMSLSLYVPLIKILAVVQNGEQSSLGSHGAVNLGWFSFASKLHHCCEANLLTIGLNNKVALAAIKPIKKGDELTISYLLHWTDNHPDMRNCSLYRDYSIVCDCQVCQEEWDGNYFDDEELSAAQKLALKKLKIRELKMELHHPTASVKYEKKIRNTLSVLSSAPNSEEYHDVFMMYKRCLFDFQHAVTKNIILSDPGDSDEE